MSTYNFYRKRLACLLAPALILGFTLPAKAAEDIPYHHLALFLGGGVEEKKDHDEDISAVGLEYEYRFSDRWGVGLVGERLGKEKLRNAALVLPVSFHAGKGGRIFFGPGHEWTDKKDKYLFRLGAGYEFKVGGHWSIAPELLVDFIETGDKTWLAGVAIGFHF